MNPHGFPSRMTIAKIFEILASKIASAKGIIENGSAF